MDEITAELQAGLTASQAGDIEQARAHFEQVLRRDPQNAAAWLSVSKLMPTPEHALRCVEQVLHHDPRYGPALERKAMLQIRLLVEEAAILETTAPIPSTAERRYLLGETLVAARVLTPDQLDRALKEQVRLTQQNCPQRLGEILIRLKLIPPQSLEAALAGQIAHLSATITDRGTGLIGAFLVRHGFVTQSQLEAGLAQQAALQRQGESLLLGEVLVRLGYLEQTQLNVALICWQQWYQRAGVTRDDPYGPALLPQLTTRNGLRQRWLLWMRHLHLHPRRA